MPYQFGMPVPLTFTLTDSAGNPVDPVTTQPVLTVTQPDATTVTPAFTHTGTGQYSAIFKPAQTGHHLVAWLCTDATHPGGYTDSFDVWPGGTVAVLSFADAKRTLRLPASDTSEDDFVQEFLQPVTDWIEWYCGPVVVQTVTEELRTGGLTVQLSKPPILSLTAWTGVPPEFAVDPARVVPVPPSPMFPVMIYGVTYPLTQLHVNARKGEVRHEAGLPFYYGPYLWQYQAGRPTVPNCIAYAARVVLRHLYGLERGGAGSAALGAGDEETTLTPFGFSVPNRAVEMLAPEAIGGGNGAIA